MAKDDVIELEGIVTEALPNTTFHVDIGNRITSYNVCYTKLLRMTENEAVALVDEDEDYDDDGFLKDEVKQEYVDKYSELDHIADQMNEEEEEEDVPDDDDEEEEGDDDDVITSYSIHYTKLYD